MALCVRSASGSFVNASELIDTDEYVPFPTGSPAASTEQYPTEAVLLLARPPRCDRLSRLVGMSTRFTVEVEEDLATRVAAAAAERGVAPEVLAAEVLAERFPPRRKLGFVSLGSSTTGRRASEDEEMLAEGFGR